MKLKNIKLIVELTKAKIEILKLKADDYTWQCHVDSNTKDMLEKTLKDIDVQIESMRKEND